MMLAIEEEVKQPVGTQTENKITFETNMNWELGPLQTDQCRIVICSYRPEIFSTHKGTYIFLTFL